MGCVQPKASCLSKKKPRDTNNMAQVLTGDRPTLYTCDICGQEGLSDADMRSHVLIEHVEGHHCPFCDLEGSNLDEMNAHINSDHLDYLTPTKKPTVREIQGKKRKEHPFESPSESSNCDTLRSNISTDSSTAVLKDPPDHTTTVRNETPVDILVSTISENETSEKINEENKENSTTNVTSLKRTNLHLDVVPMSGEKHLRTEINSVTITPGFTPVKISPDTPMASSKDLLFCPLCPFSTTSTDDITKHVNRVHLDLTSPSRDLKLPANDFECPLCGVVFKDGSTLEKHVRSTHADLLSLSTSPTGRSLTSLNSSGGSVHCCPVCGMELSDSSSLQLHIDGHFSADNTPVYVYTVEDEALSAQLHQEEQWAMKLEEQKAFQVLQEQYGMSGSDSYPRQAGRQLGRAVSQGRMSVSDYYGRKSDLCHESTTGVDDGHSRTQGVIEKLRAFYKNGVSNVTSFYLCKSTDHFAASFADKGWGCGYRNLQMLLSCLAHSPRYLQVLFNGCHQIPSIPKIQELLEAAWGRGFDGQGAEQLGHHVMGTNKWIGATEIVATLSSLKIKCQLVDFHAPTGRDSTHPRLFEWVKNYFRSHNADFTPPLYLQHQGHSRTIVGIETLRDNSTRLLLFDPSCHRAQMSQFTQAPITANLMRSVRRSLTSLKAKQYQIVAVTGILTDKEMEEYKTMKSDRIP